MSGTFDDPNREAVGLPPIWAEGETAPAAEPESKAEPKAKAPAKKAAKDD